MADPGRAAVPRRRQRDARAYIRTQHANATGRAAVPRRRQGDARAYIQPLGEHQVPHTARKCHRQSGGAQTTPGRRRRTSDPLASSKCRTQRANATGRAAVPRRRQGDARAYIRPLGKQQVPHTARKCYRQTSTAAPSSCLPTSCGASPSWHCPHTPRTAAPSSCLHMTSG